MDFRTTANDEQVLAGALSYAENGWNVYPASEKRARIKLWNTTGASRDPQTISRWFTGDFAGENVGVATGPSGLAVLDIDPRNGGNESWSKIFERFGHEAFSDAPIVHTPRGGFHLYMRAPNGRPVASGDLEPGVELKSARAGVIAPPSKCFSAQYRWRDQISTDLPTIPVALCELVRANRAASANAMLQQRIPVGQRHTQLTRHAGHLRRAGYSAKEINGMIQVTNQQRCEKPLDTAEVSSIADSIGQLDSRTDPVEWFLAWAPHFKGNAHRLLGFYFGIAVQLVPHITPARKLICDELSFKKPNHLYAVRRELAETGAILVMPRGGGDDAPEIVLCMPKAKKLSPKPVFESNLSLSPPSPLTPSRIGTYSVLPSRAA